MNRKKLTELSKKSKCTVKRVYFTVYFQGLVQMDSLLDDELLSQCCREACPRHNDTCFTLTSFSSHDSDSLWFHQHNLIRTATSNFLKHLNLLSLSRTHILLCESEQQKTSDVGKNTEAPSPQFVFGPVREVREIDIDRYIENDSPMDRVKRTFDLS